MIDGRLLMPAGAVWLGAIAAARAIGDAPSGQARSLAFAAIGALALSAVGVAIAHARGRASGGCARLTVITLVAFIAGVLAASLHTASISSEPLSGWVQARATATVEAHIAGEPVLRRAFGASAWRASTRIEVQLAVHRVTSRGVVVDVDVPLVMRMPADSTPPPPGSAVVVSGRLGPLVGQSGLAGAISPADGGVRVVGEPGWLATWAHAMRTGLIAALDGTSEDGSALVAGLAVGDESLQSHELDDAMRATGLSHLTAVSGGNVAIVVVVVVGAATALGLSLASRVIASLIALALFVVLVGPQPSVLRAAVMGAVVLVGLLVGGRRAGPSVLAASVLVLVIISPPLALSWAFALSVGATAGLILLAPWLRAAFDRWPPTHRWPVGVRDALAVTAAAQLATLPVLLLMGASVGLVALPANLLAMPAVPAVTVLGLGAAIVAPVLPAVAHLLAVVASWPAAWIALVAEVGSGLPLTSLPLPEGSGGVLLLVVVGLAAWLLRRWLHRAFPGGAPRGLVRTAVVLVTALGALWLMVPPDRRSWPPADWLLIMCDVGQGDALLFRSADESAVVVDAGSDPDRVDACLHDAGIRHVPAVVLTHFHADHVDGLTGVLRGRDVAAVYVTPVAEPPEQAAAVASLLSDAGLRATPVSAGDARQTGAVRWTVLWPRRAIRTGSVPNNASLVLLVEVAGRRLLLTGDVEQPAQSAILPDLVGVRVDVVKVPHHGSADQDPRLAPQTAPAAALISVGVDNTYGHPAAEAIEAWQAVGALVARTDLDGDVAVVRTDTGVGVVARR